MTDRPSDTDSELFSASSLTEVFADSEALGDGEVLLGTLTGFDDQGRPLVNFELQGRSHGTVPATATINLRPGQQGRQVALMFLERDLNRPLILGVVHNPLFSILELSPEEVQPVEETETRHSGLLVDGEPVEKLSLEGKQEVVLKCGDASITLTQNGKILLRGKYVVSRSSGVNRILGGSVQVN